MCSHPWRDSSTAPARSGRTNTTATAHSGAARRTKMLAHSVWATAKPRARSGGAAAATPAHSDRTTATVPAPSGGAPRKRCSTTAAAAQRRHRRPPRRPASSQWRPPIEGGGEYRDGPRCPIGKRWATTKNPAAPPYGAAEEEIGGEGGNPLSPSGPRGGTPERGCSEGKRPEQPGAHPIRAGQAPPYGGTWVCQPG